MYSTISGTTIRRLHYLCSWIFSRFIKPKRRLVWVVTCALALMILRWKLLCTNFETRLHLKNLCTSYTTGQAVGNLCSDLCQPEGLPSLSCHNTYQDKEAIFSGSWRNYTAVFKSVKKTSENVLQYWLEASHAVIPSENDFSNMIKTTIKIKFNMSINDIDIKRMLYINNNQQWPSNRHVEMENVWSLLQDNEYLAMTLYEDFNIFPKLLGTCGSLYAVQKLNSISRFWHLMTLYDSQEEWKKRINISLMILDFLLNLETGLPEPLLICNVKINNFGVTDDFKKVKYINLDSVHPLSVASRITGDGSHCKKHSDCDFLDCRSFCNLITFKCQHGVVNNNLQVVCEKIFLGWVMSGKVMVPGLLLGPRTPRVLIELLELCANPASDTGIPRAPATREIRKRLYNLLVHLKLP